MGKNLKGKECGKGIYQRKDGLYSARFYAKDGKRKEKYFDTLPEAKNWLADARYEERHNLIVTSPDMTVDKWFTYWIENIVCDLAPNTKRNYRERYKWNIQPVLGTMFKSAVMNDIIGKHPMNGVRYTKPVRAVDDIKYLTVVNWKKHTLTISKSLEYRHSQGYWRAGPPKTKKSYRTIPLTDMAYSVLKSCYDERNSRKESDVLSQVLEYTDSRTGEKKCLVMRDLVFVNWRTGEKQFL